MSGAAGQDAGPRALLLAVAACCVAALAGCGGRQALCEPDPSYYGRKDGRILDVPNDLDMPQDTGRYTIPLVAETARQNDNAGCSSYPPRIAGVKELEEREERRRKRARERDEQALAEAQAASAAAGGSASSPRQVAPPPDVEGDVVNSGTRRFAQVYDAVALWAQAWEERDFNAYLDAYSLTFQPPAPMTRSEWQDVREQRMNEGARAYTDLSTLLVYEVDDGVIARVAQSFAFQTIESTITKELLMVREQKQWRIVRERVVNVE